MPLQYHFISYFIMISFGISLLPSPYPYQILVNKKPCNRVVSLMSTPTRRSVLLLKQFPKIDQNKFPVNVGIA